MSGKKNTVCPKSLGEVILIQAYVVSEVHTVLLPSAVNDKSQIKG